MRVLFIDIDTLRADHMGCYGYHRDTTPNIDGIAAQGIRFDNYYCSDAPCLPSRAALVTGMFGIHNGAVGHGGTAADKRLTGSPRGFTDIIDQNSFHNIFRKAGMHTASISTFPERHSSWWFSAGFNETYNVGKGGMESGEEVLPVALDWVDRNASRDNWYLHLHLWDPHTPYRTPPDFANPFENDPLPSWITEDVFNEHLKHVGPHSLNELEMFTDDVDPKYPKQPGKALDLAGLRQVLDGYDCGIRYADYLIGRVFDALKQKGVFDDLAIIVTSDHGENLGELGLYSEHATADHLTCHIPMIIKWPGGRKGVSDNRLHYNLDICPTMAELLGVKPFSKWDGQSYAGAILAGESIGETAGESMDKSAGGSQGRDYLVLSQQAHVCQRSVRFDNWIYIRTVHDGFHLFPKEMLFDLENDPYEQCNVAGKYPDTCGKAARLLLEWHESMMLTSDSEIDPMWTVVKEGGPEHTRGCLEGYLERLETTGRSEGAAKLRQTRGRVF